MHSDSNDRSLLAVVTTALVLASAPAVASAAPPADPAPVGPAPADPAPTDPAPMGPESPPEASPEKPAKKNKKAKATAPEAEPATSDTDAAASGSASGGASVDEGRRYSSRGSGVDRDKWIHRWAPVRNMWELGVFGGVWFPNKNIELYEPMPGAPNDGRQRLNKVAPEVGLRAGYYPLRFLGVELEGAAMPTRTRDSDGRATAWGLRGHVVGQLGLWSVTPFLLVGTGVLGVASDSAPGGIGSEQDVEIHFGGGVKVFVNRWIQLRLDVRDVVSNRLGVGEGLASSPEVLLGLSVTLGRKKKKPAKRVGPQDRDGDRILDRDDFCPDVFGVEPRGCPTVCLDDNDADGLSNPEDSCPEEPETRNGFEDKDGCPDEVPPELDKLAGIMEGINFDTDKDAIKNDSKPILDNAIEVMKKYPDLRVRITGHTDSQGGYRHNIDLSKRRAESVRRYMIENGIDEGRMETRGAGPDEPIDTNDTAEGRAKNRRIEFQILEEEDAPK
jgi:outer membrane protein OmpA-like peptidoglycan-associated protein